MSAAPSPRGAPIRSISAVLPAFNEAANLRQVVEATLDALDDVVPEFELIIIDDGSTDATPRLADDLAATYPHVRVIHHARNRGYGNAWRSGIETAAKQYIFFMDADRQFNAAEISRLVQWDDRYDIVAGYRLRRNDPLYRVLLGWWFAILVRILFKVKLRDINCGFKLVRTSLLKGMNLISRGTLIKTEIHYRAQQQAAPLREVGVHHYPRKAGKQSGARPRAILRLVIELVVLRRQIRREQRAAKRIDDTSTQLGKELPAEESRHDDV